MNTTNQVSGWGKTWRRIRDDRSKGHHAILRNNIHPCLTGMDIVYEEATITLPRYSPIYFHMSL